MEEKREDQQVQPEDSQKTVPEDAQNANSEVTSAVEDTTRPRPVNTEERVIEKDVERFQMRHIRGVMKSRGVAPPERPSPSGQRVIQRHDKREPGKVLPVVEKKDSDIITAAENRSVVKWVAWGALLFSIVALVLVGAYSQKQFSPQFAFHNLEVNQQKILNDVEELKYITHLERVRNAVLSAHLQLLLRQDYAGAETILSNAKQDLDKLLTNEYLSVEKKARPKEIISAIEQAIREIRKPRSAIEDQLQTILEHLDKL